MLKFNFTYVTKLVVADYSDAIKNHFTIKTMRILGINHKHLSILPLSMRISDIALVTKYVDYIFLF